MNLFGLFKRDTKSEPLLPEHPFQHCNNLIAGMKTKADHNKREALLCFLLVIGASLVAPLFVTLGEGLWLGKIVPSALSLLAAGATAWLQLRKPQQLWTIYRSAQRELEDCAARYQYQIDDFAEAGTRDKRLAKQVADIALGVHHQWVPLVPNPEKLLLGEKPKKDSLSPKSL